MKVHRFIDDEVTRHRDRLPGALDRPSEPMFNVCGVLVHAATDRLDVVDAAISALPGAEIHLREADGRMVVTLEDTEDGPASQSLAALAETPGVLNVSLVYHHFDTKESMEREEASA